MNPSQKKPWHHFHCFTDELFLSPNFILSITVVTAHICIISPSNFVPISEAGLQTSWQIPAQHSCSSCWFSSSGHAWQSHVRKRWLQTKGAIFWTVYQVQINTACSCGSNLMLSLCHKEGQRDLPGWMCLPNFFLSPPQWSPESIFMCLSVLPSRPQDCRCYHSVIEGPAPRLETTTSVMKS